MASDEEERDLGNPSRDFQEDVQPFHSEPNLAVDARNSDHPLGRHAQGFEKIGVHSVRDDTHIPRDP